MLILLPPSEGKTAPRRGKPLNLDEVAAPELTDARNQLLGALAELSLDPPEAMRVLGLGPTQLEEIARNAALDSAPTSRADRIYTGVLYDALSMDTLSPAARRRATRWLLISSALFGVVRPSDRIPAYKLPGGSTLPGVGTVAGHWRGVLDPVLATAAGPGLVVDLRSGTYAAFWRPDRELAARVATVKVWHEVNGKRTVVSHFNKATKGRIVRALLETGATPRNPAALAAHLTALGWQVELGEPGPQGHQLDVIVTDL